MFYIFVLDKTKDDIRVKLLEGKPRIVLRCNGGRFLHNIIRHIFLPNFSCESNFKKNSTLYENISQQITQDTLTRWKRRYSLSRVFNEMRNRSKKQIDFYVQFFIY